MALMPSAIARGIPRRRCSRIMRWTTASPCSSLATRPLRSHVGPSDYSLEQPLLVGLFRGRDDVAEAARLLERFDEGVDVFGSPGLDADLNDELSSGFQARIDRRNAHVIGQRLLQLIEQFAP